VLLVGYVCRACVLGVCKPLPGVWAMKKPAAAAVSCVQMSKDKPGSQDTYYEAESGGSKFLGSKVLAVVLFAS
jgi:hypothetical protein